MPCCIRMKRSFLQGLLWLYLYGFGFMALSLEPGFLDFDNLPDTNFSCVGKVIGGYYADLETNCQMFHVCTIGQLDEPMDIKFLCLNGTVFDQETRVCERIDEVDCTKSEQFYSLNLELYGHSQSSNLEEIETEQPLIIKSTPTTTTTTNPPPRKTTRAPYYTSASPPTQTTNRLNSHQFSTHHFPILNPSSSDIRFNPEEINISLHPGAPPDIRTKGPISYYSDKKVTNSDSNSDSNNRLVVTTHRAIYNNEGSEKSTPSYNSAGYGFTYRQDDSGEYTEPPESYRIRTEFRPSQEYPGALHNPLQQHYKSSTYRSDYGPSTNKVNNYQQKSSSTIRNYYVHSLKPPAPNQHSHYGEIRTEKSPQRIQLPLPTLPPLTFSSPAPFSLKQRIEQKRYTKDHIPPPRIVISASASVSDASGRKLNYSLGTIGAAQLFKPPPSTYDEYKDEDVALDPFYLDVQKVRQKRSTKINYSDIIRNDEEALNVLKFLFDWYKNEKTNPAKSTTPLTAPLDNEGISSINHELAPETEASNIEDDGLDINFDTNDSFNKNSKYNKIGKDGVITSHQVETKVNNIQEKFTIKHQPDTEKEEIFQHEEDYVNDNYEPLSYKESEYEDKDENIEPLYYKERDNIVSKNKDEFTHLHKNHHTEFEKESTPLHNEYGREFRKESTPSYNEYKTDFGQESTTLHKDYGTELENESTPLYNDYNTELEKESTPSYDEYGKEFRKGSTPLHKEFEKESTPLYIEYSTEKESILSTDLKDGNFKEIYNINDHIHNNDKYSTEESKIVTTEENFTTEPTFEIVNTLTTPHIRRGSRKFTDIQKIIKPHRAKDDYNFLRTINNQTPTPKSSYPTEEIATITENIPIITESPVTTTIEPIKETNNDTDISSYTLTTAPVTSTEKPRNKPRRGKFRFKDYSNEDTIYIRKKESKTKHQDDSISQQTKDVSLESGEPESKSKQSKEASLESEKPESKSKHQQTKVASLESEELESEPKQTKEASSERGEVESKSKHQQQETIEASLESEKPESKSKHQETKEASLESEQLEFKPKQTKEASSERGEVESKSKHQHQETIEASLDSEKLEEFKPNQTKEASSESGELESKFKHQKTKNYPESEEAESKSNQEQTKEASLESEKLDKPKQTKEVSSKSGELDSKSKHQQTKEASLESEELVKPKQIKEASSKSGELDSKSKHQQTKESSLENEELESKPKQTKESSLISEEPESKSNYQYDSISQQTKEVSSESEEPYSEILESTTKNIIKLTDTITESNHITKKKQLNDNLLDAKFDTTTEGPTETTEEIPSTTMDLKKMIHVIEIDTKSVVAPKSINKVISTSSNLMKNKTNTFLMNGMNLVSVSVEENKNIDDLDSTTEEVPVTTQFIDFLTKLNIQFKDDSLNLETTTNLNKYTQIPTTFEQTTILPSTLEETTTEITTSIKPKISNRRRNKNHRFNNNYFRKNELTTESYNNNNNKKEYILTDYPLRKSINPTQAEKTLVTTPFPVKKYFFFNCFGKAIDKFYPDLRDCRLFHYCTQGYSKNQLLDMKFVCDFNTYFDDEKLICSKVKPKRCL